MNYSVKGKLSVKISTETRVYNALVGRKPATAEALAKRLKVPRLRIYRALKVLIRNREVAPCGARKTAGKRGPASALYAACSGFHIEGGF